MNEHTAPDLPPAPTVRGPGYEQAMLGMKGALETFDDMFMTRVHADDEKLKEYDASLRAFYRVAPRLDRTELLERLRPICDSWLRLESPSDPRESNEYIVEFRQRNRIFNLLSLGFSALRDRP